MIKIDKGIAPEYLQSHTVDLAIEKLEEFYLSKNREQKRYDFTFNSNIDGILKPILHNRFYGKCGYCEQQIEYPELGVVDRFRPHNGVRDDKKYFADLYWWLVFDWENLIYSCKECNQYKANYFPIKGKRATSKKMSLETEHPLLLNPCSYENVEYHFTFDNGFLNSASIEGMQTIELLKLNRQSLVDRRNKAIYEIKVIINDIEKDINTVSPIDLDYLIGIFDYKPSIEFLMAKHEYLLMELEHNPILREYIDSDSDDYEKYTDSKIRLTGPRRHGKTILTSDYFPIEYIEINNFKSIDNLKINFPVDRPEQYSWIVLLGENGVGKSSILQAIALGLKSTFNEKEREMVPSLIKKGKQKANIVIKERDRKNTITTTLTRKDKEIKQTGKFNSFLIGYGSLRLSADEVDSKNERDIRRVSYKNLFRPTEALNDVTKWLRSIHKGNISYFDSIAFSIKQLLPHDFLDNDLTISGDEIMFKKSEKKFSELSDGFKSTITLALDIMMKLSSDQADMDKMTGVVIIDELGNQLHPRWQMRIVKQLRSVFPRINFIVSTHHPLCLRGTLPREVILLKNIENNVEVITNLPDPSELRVDQLLASEFFGLSSLIDPELEADFNKYYELLNLQSNISQSQKIELDKLKMSLREKKHLGSSLREELMYSVIDNLLAQKVIFSKELMNREDLKKEVIERVKKIWSDLNIGVNDQG